MKKYIKTFSIIITALLVVLLATVLLATRRVDRTSYYECDYYKKSVIQLDSLRMNNASIYHSIEAGFSKVSITPDLNYPEDNVVEGKFKNVALAGYSAREGKFATGIHDSVFVRVAAIKVADRIMVVVGIDLLRMLHNLTDSALSMLHEDGISREQLVFSATHSHSSVGGWGMGYMGSKPAGVPNDNMVCWLASRISLAVRTAISDLKPAMIGSGNVAAASYTRNRVIGNLGTKNDDFSYMILEQIGGKKAIIGSFSAHATILSAKNLEISGEYPGYWSRKMEDSFADYAIFCAGAVGSQSSVVADGEGFERVRKFGETLADTVMKYASTTPMTDSVVFSAITMKLNLPDYHIRITRNRALVPVLSNIMMTLPKYPVLQAMRLNDMVWISTPADFSGEIALQTKNHLQTKGFDVNVTSFNGSYLGYFIPSKYYFMDQYESKTMSWFGPNMGDYIADIIRQLSDIVIL